MGSLKYYTPGIVLILMAVMVVAFPEILVALVAAAIIMVGIGALCVGHLIRKSEIGFRNREGNVFDHDAQGWPSAHGPLFRWWHKDP
ncbi:MAG: hypothetical protein SWE60_03140 [Thermodesulfobacteriota bacterium]|nr:hypothetical protein [Thermodesulfobacteriota bacterium]